MVLSASNGPPGWAEPILAWAERQAVWEWANLPRWDLHHLPSLPTLSPQELSDPPHRACVQASKVQELGSIPKSLEVYEIFQIGMKTLDKQYTQKKKESLEQKNIQIQIKNSILE